ncbi:hypothetical protein AB0J20_16450 [Micromonospora costi]|uniref:hypothetical protein n=1 Tax=Micromonospora costi TaxID=1530042 RepID=UPI003405662E
MTCAATKHGTASAYTAHRCRCATAREAWRLYNKRRREGRNPQHLTDSTGATRRIRALVALGWNFRELARRAGYSRRTVQDVAYARRPVITLHTDRWVHDLYEQLSGTPGGSRYALIVAGRYGWAPPLAWDDIDDPAARPNLGDVEPEPTDDYDPVTVGQAVEGRLTYAQIAGHRPDLVETVRRLATRLTDTEIAHQLRWPGLHQMRPNGTSRAANSITKLRHDNGIPAYQHRAVIPHPAKRRRTTQAA